MTFASSVSSVVVMIMMVSCIKLVLYTKYVICELHADFLKTVATSRGVPCSPHPKYLKKLWTSFANTVLVANRDVGIH